MVEYTYNVWGELLSVTGSLAGTIGQANPIRYRGYYYDNETGYYYLQSRYYDPETQRFLNADSVIPGSGKSVQGYNLYTYCLNNPINMEDSNGNWPKWIENGFNKVKKAYKSVKKVAADFFDYCVDTTVKIGKTIAAPLKAFEFKVGYGTGLRGSVKVAGLNITAGAKTDLLTAKLAVDDFDVGRESLAGASINTPFTEYGSLGIDFGQFESALDGSITEYNMSNPNISFDLIGIDIYLSVGVSASISYNYQRVIDEWIEIWE